MSAMTHTIVVGLLLAVAHPGWEAPAALACLSAHSQAVPGRALSGRAATPRAAPLRLRGGFVYSDEDPQRTLWYAAMLGDEETCELVLRQGADPNKLCHYDDGLGEDGPEIQAQRFASRLNPWGQCNTVQELTPSALHMACIGGHAALVQLLLRQNADVRHANKAGYTALHFAALMGHAAVCRILIEEGADVAACDIFGDQPIDRAEAEGHQEVVALLQASMDGLERTFGKPSFMGEEPGGITLEQLLDDVQAAINGSTWEKLKAGDEVALPRCILDGSGQVDKQKFGHMGERLEQLLAWRSVVGPQQL